MSIYKKKNVEYNTIKDKEKNLSCTCQNPYKAGSFLPALSEERGKMSKEEQICEIGKYVLLAVRWAYAEGYHAAERYDLKGRYFVVEAWKKSRENFYKEAVKC